MSDVRNPFILTPIVPEPFFCDRNSETDQLCKHIRNGRNVALFAPRRLGKTGLIRHCFSLDDIKREYNTFMVDIYSAGSMKEFAALFAKEVFSRSKMLGVGDKIMRGIHSITPKIEYNELTSTFSLSAGMTYVQHPEKTLEEILTALDSLSKPCVVAIDEFQKVGEFTEDNAEAFLRSAFMNCSNVTFVFTGSISHSLNNMFKSPDKPFYNSAVMMTLGVIGKEAYREFAIRMFRMFDKDVDPALVDRCYEYFGGVTWYNQLLMNEAFAQTDRGGKIMASDFGSIYDAIIAQQSFSYQDLFSRFSLKQKALLVALSREDREGASITSQEFLSKYGLGAASSVQTACSALRKNNFVTDNSGKKVISDPIFRDWLRQV
ncbi:MAG: ATP-binding protein [Bacteroidales bacterium]|nr:ATP-binding protein [Bacteroidales bacterium]